MGSVGALCCCGVLSCLLRRALGGHALWVRNVTGGGWDLGLSVCVCVLCAPHALSAVPEEVAEFTSVRGTETYVTEGSMEQARAAVGGLLALVDAALDPCDPLLRGMALCRPPGHHAGRERSEGFCLLNGVAVAAAYARARAARDVERVLIFDWDVHHGNGTQELFWTDPSVLFVSAHRQDEGFFPGSGGSEEARRSSMSRTLRICQAELRL